MNEPRYDIVVLGGGIVGLSTAWQLLQRYPDQKIALVEKEHQVGQHQTGHNSGVIHAGIYYTPGSLKARFCKEGVAATTEFCRENDIPFEQCGKLVVATDEQEHDRMQNLFARGLENGIDVALVSQQELHELEPEISGIGAIHVKATGIVSYSEICERMAQRFIDGGGTLLLDHEIVSLNEDAHAVHLKTASGDRISAGFLVACAGLMADRVARNMGIPIDFAIVPYRGEYYRLPASRNTIVKHLIYPVPDPELPFLGVHLTRMIDGSVTVGPNAVQGWKREGYGRVNISPRDSWDMLTFPGFWKVSAANLRAGIAELRDSVWKRGYLKAVRKYCPGIGLEELLPYPAGIRAQAVMRDGTLVDDFLFAESPRSLHVCNAPSPAATSAIPIGAYVCDKVAKASKGA